MRFKKFLSVFLIFGILLFGLRIPVKADGMILPPDYYPVYETEQKALIIYKDDHEDLVISISFSGKAEDFGWVIPLPSQPEISKVDSSIFKSLAEITEPKENLLQKLRGEETYYPLYGVGLEATSSEDTAKESSVEVLEEESIGIFDYAILKAEDPEDLKEWMEDNEYNLPSGDEDYYFGESSKTQSELWSDALPIFQDYIDSEWYFVTVKVSNKFEDSSGVTTQLEEGSVDPLRFSFDTTDMIYPMKMTGLSQTEVSVMLYVLDDHKVYVKNYQRDYCSGDDSEECSWFDIEYASNIKKDEISELTKEVAKGSWYEASEDMYITKLYVGYLSSETMDDDVLFKDTSNNSGVNDGSMSLSEWIQLPFVFIIYLPYLLLGGFFELIDYGGYYWGYEWGFAWFIGASIFLFFGSVIWIFLSTLFLKRCRKRLIRFLLYVSQIPSVWFVSLVLSLLFAIPFGILVGVLAQDDTVTVLDAFCCMSFITVVLPLLFYRLLWRRRKKRKSK